MIIAGSAGSATIYSLGGAANSLQVNRSGLALKPGFKFSFFSHIAYTPRQFNRKIDVVHLLGDAYLTDFDSFRSA